MHGVHQRLDALESRPAPVAMEADLVDQVSYLVKALGELRSELESLRGSKQATREDSTSEVHGLQGAARLGSPTIPDRSTLDLSVPHTGPLPPPQPLDQPDARFVKKALGQWCRLDAKGRMKKADALGDYYRPPVVGKAINTSSTRPEGMAVAEWKTFSPAQKLQHWKTIFSAPIIKCRKNG